jgi:hypothetical protein
MRIGYTAPYNENCEVHDNIIVNGGLNIERYRDVTQQGNLIIAKGRERPQAVKSFLLPNRYAQNRAHLVIYNWQKAESVEVKVKPFLNSGDAYRLLDPQDFFGDPIAQGTCRGDTIRVPVNGEFGVFVVLKE